MLFSGRKSFSEMESQNTQTLFYELCRLCLQNPGEQKILDVDELVEDIFFFTGVRITLGDNLPQKVCSKCHGTLKSAKDLRLLATNNDTHLRLLFGEEERTEDMLQSPMTKALLHVEKSSKPTEAVEENQPSTSDPQPKVTGLRVRKDLLASSSSCGMRKRKSRSKSTTPKSDVISSSEVNSSKDTSSRINNTRQDETSCSQTKRPKHSKDKKSKAKKSKDVSPQAETLKANSSKENSREANSSKDDSTNSISSSQLSNTIKAEKKYFKERITKNEDGEYIYECPVCGKEFDHYKKFYLHQRLHNRSHLCPMDVCGKRFACAGDLRKHIRVHTGEKPFRCSTCDRAFAQRGTLKQHCASVHLDFSAS